MSAAPAPGRPHVRVVVVDADRRVRRDLAELLALARNVEVVASAADAAAGLAAIEAHDPDVVVVDPRLPHLDDGLSFVAEVRRASAARIIVLCHDTAQGPRMLAFGADTFLTEDDQPAAVIQAVTAGVDAAAEANPAG